MIRRFNVILILFGLFLYFSSVSSAVVISDTISQFHEEITFVKGTTGNEYTFAWMIDQRPFVGDYYVVYDNHYYWYRENWTVGEPITLTFDSLDFGYHNVTAVNYGMYIDTEGGIFRARQMFLVHVIPSQTQTATVVSSPLFLVFSSLMITVIFRSINNKKSD